MKCALTLYCVVTHICACVDTSRTVFWDRSVIRDILHVTTVTFLDVVVKKNFPLLHVDWYQFRVPFGFCHDSPNSLNSVNFI